jgi:hypothetical protein
MMQIREASLPDAAGIARVHVDTWRSAYRGIVPNPVLDEANLGARGQFCTSLL